jgi:hypothetical protein
VQGRGQCSRALDGESSFLPRFLFSIQVIFKAGTDSTLREASPCLHLSSSFLKKSGVQFQSQMALRCLCDPGYYITVWRLRKVIVELTSCSWKDELDQWAKT